MPRVFQFVNVTDQSPDAKRENDKIARSHAASASRLRRTKPVDLSSVSAIETDRAHSVDLILAKPLSPVFGGLAATTFSPGHQQWPAEALDYFANRVMANSMSKAELTWYYRMYCTQPLVFHAMQFSAANHQDRVCGRIERTRSAKVIFHKGEAIRLLNESISDLSSVDYGVLLVAITSLMRNEPDEDQLRPDEMLLFRPHRPGVYNLNIYGRGKGTQTISVHHKAVYRMIDAGGGLQGLGAPGVAKAIAAHDMMLTSRNFERPRMPNVWTGTHLVRRVMEAHGTLTCHGFAEKVPGGLPQQMLTTISYLSALDHVLDWSTGRKLSDETTDALRSAIGDVQHRVMSLPHWRELDASGQVSTSANLYECCRWTVMLYSMAVIFPVPVASGWHVKLLEHLRGVLEGGTFEDQDTHALLSWSLVIANIAAVGTSEQHYFERMLWDLLMMERSISWTDLHDNLKQFLWTDTTCNAGGLAIWDNLWSGDVAPEGSSKPLLIPARSG